MAAGDLKRTIAFPHAPLWTERLHHLVDHRAKVGIGRLLLAQRIERPHLDHDALMLCHRRERLDVLLGDRASGPDAAEVVDYDRRAGVLAAHAIEFRQRVGVDQAAHRLVVLRRRRKHLPVTGRLQPAGHGRLREPGKDAEGAYAFLRHLAHELVGTVAFGVDDRRPGEDALVPGDHVQHIAVVKSVKAHLNQVDAIHAGRLRVLEQLFRRERRRLHGLLLVSLRQRIMGRVRRPDMYVRVDIPGHCLPLSSRAGLFPSTRFY